MYNLIFFNCQNLHLNNAENFVKAYFEAVLRYVEKCNDKLNKGNLMNHISLLRTNSTLHNSDYWQVK